MTLQRLHKLMAACGVGSRRACEEIIAQGRVQVDGKVVTQPGTQVDPEEHKVKVDGELLRPEPSLHFLLNKPRGAICSTTSAPGTPRALDFVPARARDRRLFTIGRLDVDSDGAIVLTNDGELCHLVTHPRFGVTKTYRVEVEGQPGAETLEKLRKGAWLAEGRTGEVDVRPLHFGRERSLLLVTLNEGKRREVRRLFARFGHEVRRLTRVAVGPIELGDLHPGESRALTTEEVAALRAAARAVIRLGGGGPVRGAGGATVGGTGKRSIPGREYHSFQERARREGRRAAFARKRREGGPPGKSSAGGRAGGRARRQRHAHERGGGPPGRGAAGGGPRGGSRGGGRGRRGR